MKTFDDIRNRTPLLCAVVLIFFIADDLFTFSGRGQGAIFIGKYVLPVLIFVFNLKRLSKWFEGIKLRITEKIA